MRRNINTTRHMIPDVPVIYLVEPTAANLQRITDDLARSLYSPAYINFLSSVQRPVLEEFATQVATSGVADNISQLYDQYLNFIVSEPDLFSLGMGTNTYWTMNSAVTSDEELDSAVDRIVSGLFSVVVTMGSIPIIRCPKEGAAEMIAAKLDRKLRVSTFWLYEWATVWRLTSARTMFSTRKTATSSQEELKKALLQEHSHQDLC